MRLSSSLPSVSPPLWSHFLVILSALAGLFLCTGLILLTTSHYILKKHENSFSRNMVVALPPALTPEKTPVSTETNNTDHIENTDEETGNLGKDPRILNIIKQIYTIRNISNIRIMNIREVDALLAKIGYSQPSRFPLVMTFTYDKSDIKPLETALHNIQPEALLIPPPPQILQQARRAIVLFRTFYTGAVISSFLLCFAGLALFSAGVFSAIRNTLAKEAKTLALLFQLGSGPKLLYQKMFLMLLGKCFWGGIVGISFAVLLVSGLTCLLSPFLQGLPLPTLAFLLNSITPDIITSDPILGRQTFMVLLFLVLIPFLLALISAVIARFLLDRHHSSPL